MPSSKSGGKVFDGREKLWPDWTPPKGGVLSLLPASWVPYAELMRVEKPGGLYAFFAPYLIGLSYAACITRPLLAATDLLSTAGVLLIWNVFLRGAACTINDNLDREYDRQVARCRTRPIARGAVTPTQGHIWYAIQSVFGAIAVSQLPHNCFLHAIAIQFLVSVYPFGKRFTDFPQVILSIPLAWAIVMSGASLGVDPFMVRDRDGYVAYGTASLVLSHAIWIIIFDYVNACQDTADDIKAGVRSMAVRYQSTQVFIGALGLVQVGCLVTTGLFANFGFAYFVGTCLGNSVLLTAMAFTAKRSRPENCAWWFSWGGLLIGSSTVLGLLAEYVTRRTLAAT